MSKRKSKTSSYTHRAVSNMALIAGSAVSIFFICTGLFLLFIFNNVKKLIQIEAIEHAHNKAVSLSHNLSSVEFIEELTSNDFDTQDILEIIITRPTKDDRFIRTVHQLPLLVKSELPKTAFSSKQDGPQDNEIHLFEKGRYDTVVDSTIYNNGSYFWYNVYFPFSVKDKTALLKEKVYIIRVSVSISKKQALLSKYSKWFTRFIAGIVVFAAFCFIFLMVFTLRFFYGIRLFFFKMAEFAKKAVSGTSYNLINEHDTDFAPIAKSFNSLIENIRIKEEELVDIKAKSQHNLDELFKKGVTMLKEKKLTEAEHIFKAIVYLKPSSFGSWFNLGVIYAKNAHYAESLDMFDKALAINPKDALTETYRKKVERQFERSIEHEKIS